MVLNFFKFSSFFRKDYTLTFYHTMILESVTKVNYKIYEYLINSLCFFGKIYFLKISIKSL